jgi:hypothetical protein
MSEPKSTVNFTIVPDEGTEVPRVYSNFCAIQHSPFDFTLTFCDVLPLSERQLREAQASQAVKAPIRARIAFPAHMLPGLIAALQENFRIYQETYGPHPGQLH